MTGPTAPQPRRPRLRRLLEGYKTFAVIGFNILLLFTLVNLALGMGFRIYDRNPDIPYYEKYSEELVAKAYPDLDKAEREELLREAWLQVYEFEPFTQFREKELRARWTTVSEHGFRLVKDQGPWPPVEDALNIFVLGGSTTFGYGVANEQTIPSYLQEYLEEKLQRKVRVYNFGRAGYYSSQERILLQQLMLPGNSPHLAIFIDGINEVAHYDDRPDHTEVLSKWMSLDRPSVARQQVFQDLPLVRAATALRDKFQGKSRKKEAPDPNLDYQEIYREAVETALERYFRNMQLIEAVCSVDRITPVFVWQPAPCYGYDTKYHLFATEDEYQVDGSYHAYRTLAQRIREKPEDYPSHFLWLGDMQRRMRKPLYVDEWHYAPGLCKEIAGAIGRHLIKQGFLEKRR